MGPNSEFMGQYIAHDCVCRIRFLLGKNKRSGMLSSMDDNEANLKTPETIFDNEAFRTTRELRFFDQQTLATTANISPSVISRLERGLQQDLRVSVLIRLVRTLDISPTVLVPALQNAQPAPLQGELMALISVIAELSRDEQHRIAVMLRAYLETLK